MATKLKKETVFVTDPSAMNLVKSESKESTEDTIDDKPKDVGVLGQILKSMKSIQETEVQRMAFEVDPKTVKSGWHGLYYDKVGLTPDNIIKRIIGTNGNELVCQILQARSNHLGSFGRPRTSRFSIGFEFEKLKNKIIPEEKKNELKKTIEKAKQFFWNCGNSGLDELSPMTLSQFMKMITRDGVGYGRFAAEIIHAQDMETGDMVPHCFRPTDAGSIKKIVPERELDQSTRQKALIELGKLKQEKFSFEQYKKDEYAYVQVINNNVSQAFSAEELIVYNLYPVTNLEYNHYPLSPIDQALNAITTNINITIYNKLYFQNGRAAKGAWVLKSDNLDETLIQKIRLQHQQSINSAVNAHRTPVFGITADDELTWTTIDTQGKDAEFQYLTDQNSRIILSAFQMSPEELPGYAHLARGTNTQSLSESDGEYKLVAARDVGLRPLINDMQDFFNTHLMKIFFPELAEYYQFVFSGLDHDSPEKEATRLQQDAAIHMNYDEILEKVEKTPIGKELGGQFPLNPQFQQLIQNYFTFGEILENFFGKKGAASDPRYMFYQNPFWMQQQQLNTQKAQMAMQSQMMQMNPQQGDQGQDGGDETQKSENVDMFEELNKAIRTNHDIITKMILKQHSDHTKRHTTDWTASADKHLESVKQTLGVKGKASGIKRNRKKANS